MCGRYSLGLHRGQIHQVRGWNRALRVGEWVHEERFVPRHNIAPRSNGVVLRRRGAQDAGASPPPTVAPASGPAAPAPEAAAASAGAAQVGEPELLMQTMRWGLVPNWSKQEDKTLSTTNARAEALVEGGGMWQTIKGKKRCVVLCEGYYEWLKKGKERLPHFTRPKDGTKLMLLAGLWDCVTLEGETEPLWTFSIVTTDANKEFSWLHERQPVILSSEEAVDAWLDTSSEEWTMAQTMLVRPYSDENAPLECYQVPKEVGKVGTESATFIEPVATRKDGIKAMFAKQATTPKKGAKSSSNSRSVSPTPSPKKRKRSERLSPIDEDDERGEKKKVKVEKVDAWEDQHHVEYADESNTKGSEVGRSSWTPKPTPPPSPRKLRQTPTKSKKFAHPPPGTKAITDFFK